MGMFWECLKTWWKCFGYQPVHQSSLESLMGGSICSTHFLLSPQHKRRGARQGNKGGTKGGKAARKQGGNQGGTKGGRGEKEETFEAKPIFLPIGKAGNTKFSG